MPRQSGKRAPWQWAIGVVIAPILAALLGVSTGYAAVDHKEEPRVETTAGPQAGLSVSDDGSKRYRVLWPGHRIVQGVVESVHGDLIRVNTGELLPRFLSAKEASEKGLPPLRRGDSLKLAINDHNIVVDYHRADREVWHRMIRGTLAQPLPVGQAMGGDPDGGWQRGSLCCSAVGTQQGERHSRSCSCGVPDG
jgi:hypothetical protein